MLTCSVACLGCGMLAAAVTALQSAVRGCVSVLTCSAMVCMSEVLVAPACGILLVLVLLVAAG